MLSNLIANVLQLLYRRVTSFKRYNKIYFLYLLRKTVWKNLYKIAKKYFYLQTFRLDSPILKNAQLSGQLRWKKSISPWFRSTRRIFVECLFREWVVPANFEQFHNIPRRERHSDGRKWSPNIFSWNRNDASEITSLSEWKSLALSHARRLRHAIKPPPPRNNPRGTMARLGTQAQSRRCKTRS